LLDWAADRAKLEWWQRLSEGKGGNWPLWFMANTTNDEGFWFGCFVLSLLVLVVLTVLSVWLVARLVIDGLLLVLMVDGRLALAGG
jgi:hypothetical protein